MINMLNDQCLFYGFVKENKKNLFNATYRISVHCYVVRDIHTFIFM